MSNNQDEPMGLVSNNVPVVNVCVDASEDECKDVDIDTDGPTNMLDPTWPWPYARRQAFERVWNVIHTNSLVQGFQYMPGGTTDDAPGTDVFILAYATRDADHTPPEGSTREQIGAHKREVQCAPILTTQRCKDITGGDDVMLVDAQGHDFIAVKRSAWNRIPSIIESFIVADRPLCLKLNAFNITPIRKHLPITRGSLEVCFMEMVERIRYKSELSSRPDRVLCYFVPFLFHPSFFMPWNWTTLAGKMAIRSVWHTLVNKNRCLCDNTDCYQRMSTMPDWKDVLTRALTHRRFTPTSRRTMKNWNMGFCGTDADGAPTWSAFEPSGFHLDQRIDIPEFTRHPSERHRVAAQHSQKTFHAAIRVLC